MAVKRAEELVYPPLTRLDGMSYKPKVCGRRVSCVKGTGGGYPCRMTKVDLLDLAEFFPWPKGVELCLPCTAGGSRAKYPGCIVLHEEALKAGFRLPLHPLISKFLSDVNLCPSQFTPDSWSHALAFLLKCKESDLAPPYDGLKNIYALQTYGSLYNLHFPNINLISNLPIRDSLWLDRWFLVSQSEEFRFNFPMYPGYPNRRMDKTCRLKTLQFIETIKGLPRPGPDYKKVLDAHSLEAAGLSLPHPITGPSSLDDLYDKYSSQPRQLDRPSKKRKTCTSQPDEVEFDNESHAVELDDNNPNESSLERGRDLPLDSKEARAIDTLCRPEIFTAMQQLPDIVKVAKHSKELQRQLDESRQEIFVLKREKAAHDSQAAIHSKELQRQLDESRQEIVVLKREKTELNSQLDASRQEVVVLEREKTELNSQIERMEFDKKSVEEELRETQSRLGRTTQMAKELLELSSPSPSKYLTSNAAMK